MKRVLVAALTLVLLSSCTALQKRTEEKQEAFSRGMALWVGRPVDALLLEKGPPTGSAAAPDGGRVLEYAKTTFKSGASGPYVVKIYEPTAHGRVPQVKDSGISTSDLSCTLRFKVSPDNIVESWSATGNACY